jgi:hypothetical protein
MAFLHDDSRLAAPQHRVAPQNAAISPYTLLFYKKSHKRSSENTELPRINNPFSFVKKCGRIPL